MIKSKCTRCGDEIKLVEFDGESVWRSVKWNYYSCSHGGDDSRRMFDVEDFHVAPMPREALASLFELERELR